MSQREGRPLLTFTIRGTPFAIDDGVAYLDFFLQAGAPQLVQVAWPRVLADLAAGRVELTGAVLDEIVLLDRWVEEAPRKRHYREMVRSGTTVLSGEEFFTHDGGAAIIDGLERTGQVARRFLEAFDPARADRCKRRPHPATKHMVQYIAPGTEATIVIAAGAPPAPSPTPSPAPSPTPPRDISAVDRRRLRDGAAAKARLGEEPRSRDQAEALFSDLCDGVVALQSTDDLGSPERNQTAWSDMVALQERAAAIRRRIDAGDFDRPDGPGAAP